MLSKYIVPALGAMASLEGVAAAVAGHRHGDLHKKDVNYVATEVTTTTTYVTVTVTEGDEPSSSAQSMFAAGAHSTENSAPVGTSSSTSTIAVASSTSSTVVVSTPTTMSTSATAAFTEDSVPEVAAPDTTATVASTSTSATSAYASATSASSTSTGRRGLAYNDASYVSAVTSSSSAFSWCYNWGSTSDGLSADITYIPMLWGPTHSDNWDTNAEAGITAGADALLSFNECDMASQANLSPAAAAAAHQQYMNPYKSKARIGAPSITSSVDAGMGLDWLNQWIQACGGSCAFDFVNVHWYGPGGEAGAQQFLDHLVQVHQNVSSVTGTDMPLWVTEFAPADPANSDVDGFMTYALDQLDNNSTFTFVEKYSYFYLATGYLLSSGTTLSSYGQIYASAS